jgi:hypothetical protein
MKRILTLFILTYSLYLLCASHPLHAQCRRTVCRPRLSSKP